MRIIEDNYGKTAAMAYRPKEMGKLRRFSFLLDFFKIEYDYKYERPSNGRHLPKMTIRYNKGDIIDAIKEFRDEGLLL